MRNILSGYGILFPAPFRASMKRTSGHRRATAFLLTIILAVPAWTASSNTPQLPNPGFVGMSREDQGKLGLEAMAEVYKQMPVLPDSSPITQYVQQLGKKLERQIPSETTWPYEFHVVQQKEINAFALPGGPIFINVGTINAAANEAQLAGVMSHEMSHVYMQHSAKQATSPKRTIVEVLGALGGALGGSTLGDLARVGIQFGAGTMLLRYSRADEAQADSVGAIIMYKAGYNPMELANFFETLAKQGGSPPQFLSDHPNPGDRSAAIGKEIRYWPTQKYLSTSQSFTSVKKQASGVKSYGAQEISDGAKQGLWAKQNIDSGATPKSAQPVVAEAASSGTVANVTFDQVKPSGQFTEVHQNGISISYPSNWSTASGKNSLQIAPKAGITQNAIAYGVVVSGAEDPNAGSLDQVADDLIKNLIQTNPGMHQNGDLRQVSVNGASGRSADLFGSSPVQQNGKALAEHDWLVLLPRPGGTYLYLIFIAPENDFAALKPTFQKMIDGLRVE
jgi:Zn-dependent protease with chaperone function